jgi:predicted ATPase
MPELPTGTVTFFFTDIEGSTRLLDELGAEAYAEALAEHRRIVRDAVARHGGVEVDTQGDAFFVAFADANAALTAAADTQRDLADHRIRVRMGLHTGTARVSGGGYVGGDVHLGARIAAAGHGGQVLFSGATRGLVSAEVLDLGQHRLKDFDAPVSIFQLGHDRFPPLRTVSNTNLPRPASALVGRTREIAEITARLQNGARLLTLTGPGGTGKTRLAIEAATELVPLHRNGVFWVPLSALTDPTLVLSEVGQTIGAKDDVAGHVGSSEMLLLLDNFEQVVAAAPELGRLLATCPNLRLLVTSRERLRIAGEVDYAVPPLAESEAVELFAMRAGVAPKDDVAELCRRLDNLPLAVELAAARASVLSPAQMLERLGQRLDLLKGGRDADARQQTLRATIEWSHDLLNVEEQALFARLAVFRGGCTLEAAEQVVGANLDTLQSLIDKSLVRRTGERFWMLETIREFALERLEASGEAGELVRRHAEFFVGLGADANRAMHGAFMETDWLDRLGLDYENIRSALERLLASRRGRDGFELAAAMLPYWRDRAYFAEGRRWLDAFLLMDKGRSARRASALLAASQLATLAGDSAMGRRRAEEALRLYRGFDDSRGVAMAEGDLGYALINEGEPGRARPLLESALARSLDNKDEDGAMWQRLGLMLLYAESGESARGRELADQNLRAAAEHGNAQIRASTLDLLAQLELNEGLFEKALRSARESLSQYDDLADPHGIAIELRRCARVLAHQGHAIVAVHLLAAADQRQMGIGGIQPWVARITEETLRDLSGQLDKASFDRAWQEGHRMEPDKAVQLALGTNVTDER